MQVPRADGLGPEYLGDTTEAQVRRQALVRVRARVEVGVGVRVRVRVRVRVGVRG